MTVELDSSRISNDTSIDFSPEHRPVVRCSDGQSASSSTRNCRQVDFLIPTQRLFGSTTGVTRVSLTDMRNINNPALQAGRFVLFPTRATCFIRDTLVFVRAPSDVSSFVLTAIHNENRELSHTTPEAAKRTPEAATLATLVLPINWRVTRVV